MAILANRLRACALNGAPQKAHSRRKSHELHANHQSQIAEAARKFFAQLYEIEREVRDLDADQRLQIHQAKARPVADALDAWMLAQPARVPKRSGTAEALDCSPKRWSALTRFIDDASLPADNNWVESQARLIVVGRSSWLFAGSPRAAQRAAAIRA